MYSKEPRIVYTLFKDPGILGAYELSTNTIYLNSYLLKKEDEVKVIEHEKAHWREPWEDEYFIRLKTEIRLKEKGIDPLFWMINEKNLVRHELIGLKVKIVKSLNPTLKNLKGIVIDETYNTFKIRVNGKDKVVAKKICTFVFELPNGKKVKVEGSVLLGRPEDRIKKKFKRW